MKHFYRFLHICVATLTVVVAMLLADGLAYRTGISSYWARMVLGSIVAALLIPRGHWLLSEFLRLVSTLSLPFPGGKKSRTPRKGKASKKKAKKIKQLTSPLAGRATRSSATSASA